MKTIIKNGLVITFIHEGYHSIKMKYADVLIENGVFQEISECIGDAGARIIDAKGLWVLPGLIDVGSSCAASVLCNGLIADYSRARWQGSMIHGRVLPMLDIAAETLDEQQKRDVVRYALLSALDGGTTTLAELTHPAFADAVRSEGKEMGLRMQVRGECTANGYPFAEHSGRINVPDAGGGQYAGGGLYSIETTSPQMYEQARADAQPLMVRAAYCEYEKQISRMQHGTSPIGKLNDEGLIRENTIVVGGYDADFFDRERLRTAGSSVAMSAVTAMQDGVGLPIVTMLSQNINTCLSTGYYGMSMIDEMRQAAFGGKMDSNASQFQASDAFYAATIAPAQALGLNAGRIEAGFAADALLVDPARLGPHNYPLIQFVYRAQNDDIVLRMVGGNVLKSDRAALAKCSEKAHAAAQKVWREAQRFIL